MPPTTSWLVERPISRSATRPTGIQQAGTSEKPTAMLQFAFTPPIFNLHTQYCSQVLLLPVTSLGHADEIVGSKRNSIKLDLCSREMVKGLNAGPQTQSPARARGCDPVCRREIMTLTQPQVVGHFQIQPILLQMPRHQTTQALYVKVGRGTKPLDPLPQLR